MEVLSIYHCSFRWKVEQAEIRGAKGVILYSDPDDITSGDSSVKVYPEDWWLPPSGAQRGSIKIGIGDQLTKGYPATGKIFTYLINILFNDCAFTVVLWYTSWIPRSVPGGAGYLQKKIK